MATIKKAQSGAKTTKKPKTVSQRIGDITLRDVKNAGEDALNISTLGGYSKVKKALGGEYKYKKIFQNLSVQSDNRTDFITHHFFKNCFNAIFQRKCRRRAPATCSL